MVGRDQELTQLRHLVAPRRRPTDEPTVVTISGEAGVGKSRLLREALLTLETGTLVLAGQAEEGDLARPFEALRDAVETAVSGWEAVPDALGERAHGIAHVLNGLVPTPHGPSDHDHALDELLRAAVDLLKYLSGGRPTVIAFEDLHWADAESVALFGRLATRPELPITLVGTFRPEDFDRRHPLAGLLSDLERQRSVSHIELARLSRPELSEMLEAVFSKRVSWRAIDALHRRTHGNPFFVEELLASNYCNDPEDLATAPLPWNVAEAVLRRVDGLDADARTVLEAAAVLGTRIPFDLLGAVSGVGEDHLIPLLRSLVASGLLVEGETDVFTFRHALTREAVVSALLGRERRRLHERALAELRAAGSDDHAALARHAAGARQFDEVVAHARTGAARYLRESSPLQALNLAELGLAEAPDDCPLRSTAASAAYALAMIDDAERHGQVWRELAVKAEDVASESAALRLLALLAWRRGDSDRYRRYLADALERAETLGPSTELAWCLAFRSQAHMLAGEAAQAIEWSQRTLAMADEVGAAEIQPYALVNLGTSLTDTRGREDDGLALLDRARREALARNDGITVGRAINNALAHTLYRRSPDEALPLLQLAEHEAERSGFELMAAKLESNWLQYAVVVGDMELADEHLARGGRLDDDPGERGVFLDVAGHLALERGDVEAAVRLRDEVLDLGPTDPYGKWLIWSLELDVAVAAHQDHDRLRAALRRFRAAVAECSDAHPSFGEPEGATALHAVGARLPTDEVRAHAAAVLPEPGCDELEVPWRAHVVAALLEADSNVEGAIDAYARCLAAALPNRPRFWVSEAHFGLARCLLAAGDHERARDEAGLAVELLARWPGWRRDRAEALLRRLSPGAGRPDGGLTARELEVLGLVAEGLSNRGIAERLYISTKTAAVHVSNILAKTGASSRGEAAAWAHRTGVL